MKSVVAGKQGVFAVLLSLVSMMLYLSSGIAAEAETQRATVDNQLEMILTDRLAYYSRLYPDILFLNMLGGEKSVSEMTTLDILLGHKPTNLDYEHPLELREELMHASTGRLWVMLENQFPSASLFRADRPEQWQEKICVLTIEPRSFATSDYTATGHLLDLPDEIIQSIPVDKQLNREDYLLFVIDHEVYHCLRAAYTGPQPMSDRELWGEYFHYLDEKGADIFALIMHCKKYGRHTEFMTNIRRIRSLSLLTADHAHLTTDVINELMKKPVDNICKNDELAILALANIMKDAATISYEEFLSYLVSVNQVMKELKINIQESKELMTILENSRANQALVNKLEQLTITNLEELLH